MGMHVCRALFHKCDVAFVIRRGHTCGDTRVDMSVGAVALYVWEQTMLDGTTVLIHAPIDQEVEIA